MAQTFETFIDQERERLSKERDTILPTSKRSQSSLP